MISSQIDELRQMADGQATYRDARAVMLQAADTIWQLRDDLQRANAENAKLRRELESVGTAAYLYGRTDLADENDKLRELCRDLFGMCTSDCLECIHGYDSGSCKLYDRMRELKVEVSK